MSESERRRLTRKTVYEWEARQLMEAGWPYAALRVMADLEQIERLERMLAEAGKGMASQPSNTPLTMPSVPGGLPPHTPTGGVK